MEETGHSVPTQQESASQTEVQPAKTRDRRRPRISDTPPAAPPPARLADYEAIIGKSQLDELRFLADALRGKTVKMVNSTALGGGVAGC
jgi:hypothetical protein